MLKFYENSPLYNPQPATHRLAPMTFAAINWLSISINLILILHIVICLLMVLLILMQRPKQEGLGAAFGGGVTDQVFGARTTNVLQRGTVYLGSLFFILSLVLAILFGAQNRSVKTVTKADLTAKPIEIKPPVPVTPEAPKSLTTELPTVTPEETPAAPPIVSPEPAPTESAPTVTPEPAPTEPTPAPAPTEQKDN